MSTFTRDEIVAKLVAQNIPRHMAERAADQELGVRDVPTEIAARASRMPAPIHELARPGDRLLGVQLEAKAPIEWPFRLLLPWSLLVSDNDREEPYIAHTEQGIRPARRKTKRCKEAQAKIAQLAKGKLGDVEPATVPLEITARVWVPNNQLRSDVQNFAKATHDALEGIVYANDNLLYWNHWLRVGVDVDAPRAELTIVPLPSSGG